MFNNKKDFNREMKLLFVIILIVIILVEIYVYIGIRSIFMPENQKFFHIIYFLTVLVTVSGILSITFFAKRGLGETNLVINTLFGMAFTFILIKILIADFLLLEDIYRFIRFAIEKTLIKGDTAFVTRSKVIGLTALAVASMFFILSVYGLFYGKYNYKVRNISLSFKDLPEEFDGFRILQISDIHSGTFDNFAAVKRGVGLIKKQNADLILFTGDLVNNLADEIKPYVELFGSITVPYGKYSILGNHDYGHYYKWPSQEAWQKNMNKLADYHRLMGFRLLKNESVEVKKDSAVALLAGVENWGRPPFHQYGDLNKTFENSRDSIFTILMSHDPSHWDEQVLKFGRNIQITLSGHTHGMQIGIETARFRWSPVQYIYKKWGGLYKEGQKYLYVNRGFGFIGFPARIGIRPEITVIELKKKKDLS